jgi:Xaa-Pro aminopeptidase
MFNSEVYKARRQRLAQGLKSGLALIPGNNELPFNYAGNAYPFRQDSTFLYFVGVDTPGLFAAVDCGSGEEWLFGVEDTAESVIWNGRGKTLAEKAASCGIENVRPAGDLESFIKGYNGKVHFINPYSPDIKILLSDLLGVKPGQLSQMQSLEMISVASSMRKIKEEVEIKEIENAVNITSQMHSYLMRYAGNSEEYFSERDIAGKVYEYALTKGYFTSFTPIVTVHGEIFHNRGYNDSLKRGRLLLIDAGVETSSHYCGDMTRTIPLGGRFSKRQKEIYDIVVKASWGIVESARPGISWTALHKRAARIITSGLKDLELMKGDTDEIVECGAYALFFPHGLGHLMGLDVHDMENYGEDNVGYSAEVKRSELFGLSNLRYGLEIQENMVMTNEPGIYFIPELMERWKGEGRFKDFINYDKAMKYKDFGGIRIEDDLLITSSGCRVLGKPLAKTSKEVESEILGK